MIVWYAVLKVWGFVSPFLGPLAVAGRNWLPALDFGRFVMPLAVFAAACVIGWGAWSVFSSPRGPQMVSVHEVRANRLAAELEAKTEANRQLQAALVERDRQLELERTASDTMIVQQEALRAQSSQTNPTISGTGVLSANDPWLRSKLKSR
jgi:hypothetical protein